VVEEARGQVAEDVNNAVVESAAFKSSGPEMKIHIHIGRVHAARFRFIRHFLL
jgi:hypothetical protein